MCVVWPRKVNFNSRWSQGKLLSPQGEKHMWAPHPDLHQSKGKIIALSPLFSKWFQSGSGMLHAVFLPSCAVWSLVEPEVSDDNVVTAECWEDATTVCCSAPIGELRVVAPVFREALAYVFLPAENRSSTPGQWMSVTSQLVWPQFLPVLIPSHKQKWEVISGLLLFNCYP